MLSRLEESSLSLMALLLVSITVLGGCGATISPNGGISRFQEAWEAVPGGALVGATAGAVLTKSLKGAAAGAALGGSAAGGLTWITHDPAEHPHKAAEVTNAQAIAYSNCVEMLQARPGSDRDRMCWMKAFGAKTPYVSNQQQPNTTNGVVFRNPANTTNGVVFKRP